MTDALTIPTDASLDGVEALVKEPCTRAAQFVVTSQSENEAAERLRIWIKNALDELESQRKAEGEPFRQVWLTVNARYKPLTQRLQDAYTALGKAQAAFLDAQAAEHERALRATVDAYAAGNADAARESSALASAAAEARVTSSTSVRKVWRAEVVDAHAVPREWCTPDVKRIEAQARATKPDATPMPIAGVKYTLEAVVTTRRGKA